MPGSGYRSISSTMPYRNLAASRTNQGSAVGMEGRCSSRARRASLFKRSFPIVFTTTLDTHDRSTIATRYVNRHNVPLTKRYFPNLRLETLEAGHWGSFSRFFFLLFVRVDPHTTHVPNDSACRGVSSLCACSTAAVLSLVQAKRVQETRDRFHRIVKDAAQQVSCAKLLSRF